MTNSGFASSAAGLSAAMSSSTEGLAVESGTLRKNSPASTGESTSMVREVGLNSTTPRASLSASRPVAYFQPAGRRIEGSKVMSSVCATFG